MLSSRIYFYTQTIFIRTLLEGLQAKIYQDLQLDNWNKNYPGVSSEKC